MREEGVGRANVEKGDCYVFLNDIGCLDCNTF